MGTTPLAAFPYPEATDDPNVPADIQTALLAVEKKSMLTFTTATARNSAITSPVAGMLVYLTTPKQWTLYDGTGWIIMSEPEQTYTPAYTGVTIGNGVASGRYYRSGGRCYFTTRFVLGSTSAVTGPVTVEVPIIHGEIPAGSLGGSTYDANVGLAYPLMNIHVAAHASQKTVQLYALSSSGSYAGIANLSSTIPFGAAYAVNDEIELSGWYPMNTPYL